MAEITPLHERLGDELDKAQETAFDRHELVEPTDEERRNGWTAETLTQYIADRAAAAELKTDPHSLHRRLARRPTRQNHKYSPHRWRG